VPLILNGVPEDYGLDGVQPGISFSTIDYEAQGRAIGEELGNCINEKLGGEAQVIMEENSPGTAGKEELETSAKEALAATAPGAEIVATVVVSDRAKAQTDIGNALQGNPDVQAVLGNNDEGALGAIGAFKAAGKELPCITEAGGNEEVLGLAETGEIYAVVALQFQDDMVQSFDNLVAMIDDPEMEGQQLTVPQEVVKAES
jgi:ribose transport system substrate-binding protein